jgi:hypothetical protein
MQFAEGDNGLGLRASMWLLERLFPGDYAPRMAERFAHRNFEDRNREREEEALQREHEREVKAEREAQAAEAQERYRAVLAAYEAEIARNASAAPRTQSDPPAGTEPVERENAASASESDSHNSRNSAEAEPQPSEETAGRDPQSKEPGRPRPLDPNCEAALLNTRNDDSVHEPSEGSAAARSGSMGRGRPGSLNEASPAESSFTASESDSHNSRNSSPSTGSSPAGSLVPAAAQSSNSLTD